MIAVTVVVLVDIALRLFVYDGDAHSGAVVVVLSVVAAVLTALGGTRRQPRLAPFRSRRVPGPEELTRLVQATANDRRRSSRNLRSAALVTRARAAS
jgi:hypothetical protein